MNPKLTIFGVITSYDYGESGYISAASLKSQLDTIGPDVTEIDVHINSIGGEVLEGFAIYNMLVQHPARIITHIDGAALSMGSIIAMAGDEIHMPETAFFMIHNPHSGVYGEAEDMRAEALVLEKMTTTLAGVYAARSGRPAQEFLDMMAAETWMDGKEAKKFGLATFTSKSTPAAPPQAKSLHPAQASFVPYKNAPKKYLNSLNMASVPTSARGNPSGEDLPTGQKEEADMNTAALILALGLAANATEQEIIARAQSLNVAASRLNAATNQTSLDASEGIVLGWKTKADAHDALATELEAIRAADGVRAKAEAVAKLPPAMRTKAEALSLDAVQAIVNSGMFTLPVAEDAQKEPEQTGPSLEKAIAEFTEKGEDIATAIASARAKYPHLKD